MRPLSIVERDIIHWFADCLDDSQRRQLLRDVEIAAVEVLAEDGSLLRFHIQDYLRPPRRFDRPLPQLHAGVQDADGVELWVELSEDENGRLYELQVVRCEDGDIIGPDWTTLRLLRPDEVIDLGLTDLQVRRHGWIKRTEEKG